MAEERDKARYSSIQNCWRILRLIAASRYGLSITELKEKTELSKRTLERIMAALEDLDIGVEYTVETDGCRRTRRYRCPNFIILSKYAPRARYCRACKKEIPTTMTICSSVCRTVLREMETYKKVGRKFDPDKAHPPRGTWSFEHGHDPEGYPVGTRGDGNDHRD